MTYTIAYLNMMQRMILSKVSQFNVSVV